MEVLKMDKKEKGFIENIEKALKQIREGKGLTKEQVFGNIKEGLRMDFVLELMKLPVDRKTNAIKVSNVNKIIDIICIQLETANPNIMETLDVLADKQIMNRFKQKSKGRNIPLDKMKKKFS